MTTIPNTGKDHKMTSKSNQECSDIISIEAKKSFLEHELGFLPKLQQDFNDVPNIWWKPTKDSARFLYLINQVRASYGRKFQTNQTKMVWRLLSKAGSH